MTMHFGKLKAFRDEGAARRAGMWAQAALLGYTKARTWCEREGIVIARAAGESSNAAGGYLVPTELGTAIVDRREHYGVFRQVAQVVPLGTDVATWPASGTGATAYDVTAEGTAITETNPTLASVGLTARKLGALVRTSSEFEEDAAIALGDWLADEIGRAFAKTEDQYAFTADGTSTYGGAAGAAQLLLDSAHSAGKVTAGSGHDTMAELDMTDIGNVMGALPAAATPGAFWFCSQFFFANVFCRLAADYGGIFVMPDASGRLRPWFAGFPVCLTQVMPAVSTSLLGQVMLLFGDMNRAGMLGDRREMTIGRSTQGPSVFAADQVLFKGTERVAINVHGVGDSTTAGSIVGLVGG